MKKARLVLANGLEMEGMAIGAEGTAVGELVFNTSMTGYQEILTDPSYCDQIVTLTAAQIGNTGINSEDKESERCWCAGLIIRQLAEQDSNWRSEQSLGDYLKAQNIIGLSDIDTRHLTQILRQIGAQGACITTELDYQQALAKAQQFSGLEGKDLANVVSTKQPYPWCEDRQLWSDNAVSLPASQYHVVAYDFGVKQNILRLLVEHGARVTVVPAQLSAAEVMALKPDGIFLSNGPGDPKACDYAIAATKQFLEKSMPIFGICLGFQILALALGAKTRKMKFGHHGGNHPVLDLASKKIMITSQNHGFMVDEAELPSQIEVTHRSLFDQTIQGIRCKNAFGFQGHPEASPGPHDVMPLFHQFIQMMAQ